MTQSPAAMELHIMSLVWLKELHKNLNKNLSTKQVVLSFKNRNLHQERSNNISDLLLAKS